MNRTGRKQSPFGFTLEKDDRLTRARAGVVHTAHGDIPTPAFCPVGTAGTVRGLAPWELERVGAKMLLANTYHLSLRPGEQAVDKAGGLHRFMGWSGPILTDSGGFQVFSLEKKIITDDGVRFRTPSGEEVWLTPERAVEIQEALGSDIAMILDECVAYPCTREVAEKAVERTLAWSARAKEAHRRSDQVLFGIVQGSVHLDLRERSARGTVALDFPGYAIGGVSVGEGFELVTEIVGRTTEFLPEDAPRYVMGVGLPLDVLACVERGADFFDCVIPTRHGRGGTVYTRRGPVRLQHRRYRGDQYAIDRSCECPVCKRFSRAYLHHLFQANEILGPVLASLHNIAFYQDLVRDMRRAVLDGRFADFAARFRESYGGS